jgi:hypothetical protein
MQKKSRIITRRGELRIQEIEVAMDAPVAATLAVKNGTTSTLTLTSIKGEDIGNATTFAAASSTNVASVAISGTAISANLHVDGTNGIDTKVSDIKTLLDANSNIAAIVTVTTTKDGVMVTNAATALAGGDDKLTISEASEFAGVTLIRDLKGVYTLTMDDYKFQDYSGCMADLSGDIALSGVAKVEVSAVDSDTFTVRLADYAGAAVDVTGASKLHLKLLDAKLP